MNVDELIQKAKESLGAVGWLTAAGTVSLGGKQVEVQFAPMTGPQWRDFTSTRIPRAGAVTDAVGFNVDEATREYPKFRVVAGGEIDDLRRTDDEGNTRYVWGDVYDVLDPAALDVITQSLLSYHLFTPMHEMVAAGKASKGGRGKKPGSPASSGSRSKN